MIASPAEVLETAIFHLDLQAKQDRPAISELIAKVDGDKRVRDTACFEKAVFLREDECSTSIGAGVSFPHARTDCVADLILAVGRSTEGIKASDGSRIHLVFLIGTPKTKIQEYLMVVGFLARSVKQKAIFEALLHAGTADAFIKAFPGK